MDRPHKLLNKIRNAFRILLNSSCFTLRTLQSLTFLNLIYKTIISKSFRNIRSIYYSSVTVFKSQPMVVRLLKKYTREFGCREADLGIKPGLKGFIIGRLKLMVNGTEIRMEGKCLIPDMNQVDGVEFAVNAEKRLILVVEKETIADRLEEEVMKTNNLIIICGKGYPCRNTLKLIEMLGKSKYMENINKNKLYCMTDYDPHGLKIFMIYKKRVERIERIGLDGADLFKWHAERVNCATLSVWDYRMIKHLENTEMKRESRFIEGLGYKFELESVVCNVRFNLEEYLTKKDGDFEYERK